MFYLLFFFQIIVHKETNVTEKDRTFIIIYLNMNIFHFTRLNKSHIQQKIRISSIYCLPLTKILLAFSLIFEELLPFAQFSYSN